MASHGAFLAAGRPLFKEIGDVCQAMWSGEIQRVWASCALALQHMGIIMESGELLIYRTYERYSCYLIKLFFQDETAGAVKNVDRSWGIEMS